VIWEVKSTITSSLRVMPFSFDAGEEEDWEERAAAMRAFVCGLARARWPLSFAGCGGAVVDEEEGGMSRTQGMWLLCRRG